MDFKKNWCRYFFVLLLVVSFSTLASAQACEDAGFMGRFQQDENVTITQACPTCTFLNITITNPNSTVLAANVPMTLSAGVFSYGPNSTISSVIGIYFVQGVSNLEFPFKACYEVTNVKSEISTSESIIYIILTASVFLMFLFCVWGAIGLPARNRRNELDRVISIEIWKYPKIGLMFLSYALFTWFINIIVIMSNSLVTLKAYQGFFEMIFTFLMAGLYVVFVFMIVIFFILGAKDLKLQDFLTRGISPR